MIYKHCRNVRKPAWDVWCSVSVKEYRKPRGQTLRNETENTGGTFTFTRTKGCQHAGKKQTFPVNLLALIPYKITFSSSVKMIFSRNHGSGMIHKMQVNGYRHFERQKGKYRHHKMNPCGSWWYIEVFWRETIGLWKKLNIIYNIITCNPEPQTNGEIRFFPTNWFIQNQFTDLLM